MLCNIKVATWCKGTFKEHQAIVICLYIYILIPKYFFVNQKKGGKETTPKTYNKVIYTYIYLPYFVDVYFIGLVTF